jgi:hypothetical protein
MYPYNHYPIINTILTITTTGIYYSMIGNTNAMSQYESNWDYFKLNYFCTKKASLT